jgi:hypothetical protein
MSRYIAICYNNSGDPSYHPIEADDQTEAEAIANWITESREPGSGVTEFMVDVMLVESLHHIADNVVGEKNPFTVKDTEDSTDPDIEEDTEEEPDIEEDTEE